MFQRFQSLLFAILSVITSSGASLAQDHWVKVGSVVVDRADTDATIALPEGLTAKSVRLLVKDGRITLRAFVVHFGAGRVHLEERPIGLSTGERTRPTVLDATDQALGAIQLVLEPATDNAPTAPFGATGATVEAWALTAAAQQRVSYGPRIAPATRTVLIGKTRPGHRGFEKVAAPAKSVTPVKSLKLENKGSSVTFDSVQVDYQSGRSETVDLTGIRLGKNEAAEVNLGSTEPIADVKLRYQSRDFFPGAPAPANDVIEVSGRVASGTAAPSPTTAKFEARLGTLDACVKAKTCTTVPVFFGTDRSSESAADPVRFDHKRADRLQLGRVFVTVPRANRRKGELNVPSTWDAWVRGSPPGGDPQRHFTIPKGGVSLYDSDDAFIAAVKENQEAGGSFKDHAFIYVHGYRVPWEFAVMRTAQIAYDLSPDDPPFGTAFLYSWPSGGGTADYSYDEASARLAIPHLTRFMRLVAERSGAAHLHVIAHSMGNFPLVYAISELAKQAPAVRINQVILAAPDIDKIEFEKIAANVAAIATGVTLYASASDNALLLSRLGHKNTPRAGGVKEPPGPALVAGIDTVDITALSTGIFSWFSWNHDKYANSSLLLNDISTLFRKGERPPNQRNLNFRPEPPKPSPVRFWRYKE